MKISIGHRLFLSVLLAILVATVSGVLLMRHKVTATFADYAVGIELDRLDQLSNALARQHRAHGGWRFLPQAQEQRGDWVAQELARLQHERELQVNNGASVAPPETPAARRTCADGYGRAVLADVDNLF